MALRYLAPLSPVKAAREHGERARSAPRIRGVPSTGRYYGLARMIAPAQSPATKRLRILGAAIRRDQSCAGEHSLGKAAMSKAGEPHFFRPRRIGGHARRAGYRACAGVEGQLPANYRPGQCRAPQSARPASDLAPNEALSTRQRLPPGCPRRANPPVPACAGRGIRRRQRRALPTSNGDHQGHGGP